LASTRGSVRRTLTMVRWPVGQLSGWLESGLLRRVFLQSKCPHLLAGD
jgi:hypothetical protein